MTTPALTTTAHNTLNAVVAYFATAGIQLPTRQYVSPGIGVLVAMDDEQVTVNLNRIYSGLPGQLATGPVQHMRSQRAAEFAVQIYRDIHGLVDDNSGVIPTAAEIASDFEVAVADLETMWMAIEDARANNLIVPMNTPFAIQDVSMVGPQGGLAGVMATFAVAIT